MAGAVGPGPGAYMLPPVLGYDRHDSRKQRMPQYSFGVRTNTTGRFVGPGPGAYMIDRMTRYGKGGGLEYSMAPRTPTTDKRFGPGPAAHDVHLKPFLTGTNAPSYSMGLRCNYDIKKQGPGPNAYRFEINPVKPASPAYSMGLQTKRNRLHDSPGPAAYVPGDLNVHLQRAPQYTMTPRNGITSKTLGPGPNYYDLMYYRPGKKGNSYSFGIRHSPFAPPMIVKCDNG
ncbi:ciliary microtubule associated protein 1B-like [Drosophila tropicalis]|uniref:ciliary microtubule associated protein 1B-like n=1 Tax=Drosophila tropicalis TaxID=46794 RepID=UPI0035AC0CCF